ncbi:MAG: hypothetical protein HYV17_04930 [Xanthomonadales bacterium]|nr:hypothetical protein [Xanthomonadales bacterium]
MPDRVLPDLRVHSIPNGSHGSGWDLGRYLYRGAAAVNRTDVDKWIAQGRLGEMRIERLELLEKIHAEVEGASVGAKTKKVWLSLLAVLIAWADQQDASLTLTTAKAKYLAFVDHLRDRVAVKTLAPASASTEAKSLAALLGPVLDPNTDHAAEALLKLSGIKRPKPHRRSRGLQADKQRMDHSFAFGHFLADVCTALTVEAVRGPVPLDIPLSEGRGTLRLLGGVVSGDLDPNDFKRPSRREKAVRPRAALAPDADAKESRHSLINVRINAEMLMFIAQTGMNLSQAVVEPRAEYRWQTEGDEDYIVRAVYKGRRQGVAKFVVFRSYRDHLKRYLDWLDALGLNDGDDRLFPILYPRQLPPAHELRDCRVLRDHCKALDIPFVAPRTLRNTRVNWLLRRSRDPELTAEMAAHAVETLLRVYDEGDLQSASQEIGKYHAETDPTLRKRLRTIPACLKGDESPRPLPDTPKEAPQPDCVTPEGCLWCEHFRDVLAPDYCWRLASHRHLHSLVISLYRPPESQPLHPSYLVIDRLTGKLKAIAARSAVCAEWVKEADERIREGDHHPRWAGLIKLVERFQ